MDNNRNALNFASFLKVHDDHNTWFTTWILLDWYMIAGMAVSYGFFDL